MKRFYSLSTLVLTLLVCNSAIAQDFSNKGKDFWLCFPSHVPSSNVANQFLFITSDQNSSGVVSYNGITTSFSVVANQITTVPIVRANAYIDPTMNGTPVNRGIRVLVDPGQPAVVVYTEIYASARTEASLILPVNVLGRKYRAISYYQNGTATGGNPMRSQFDIIAVEANTTVQIQLWKNGVKSGSAYNVTLPNVGDVYQYQESGNPSLDLTGTDIQSIAVGNQTCKKIAVFSGSSSLAINSGSCTGGSYDPLMQQCYPVPTWGKNYGVVPIAGNPNGFQCRVMASEDNTTVQYGGTVVTLNAGQMYPATTAYVTPQTQPFFVSADKPICVAQYFLSDNCSGGVGDPEMIILNPIEQNISNITIFTSTYQSITSQRMNVLIQTSAASSFKVNGVPTGGFIPMPTNPQFSYLNYTFPYGNASYTLSADSGFNAICYGLGSVETYGYSAGTNVRDLYNQIGFITPWGDARVPATCIGIPVRFRISLGYLPDSMYWDFHGFQTPNVFIPNPVPYDSQTVVNGKPVYWFSLPTLYTYNTAGSFPVTITTYTASGDGCGSQQDVDFNVTVYNNPIADFNFTPATICLNSPVTFTDLTNGNGRSPIRWYWDLGDGNTATLQNITHTYASAGSYNVRHTALTDIGCRADTVLKVVTINPLPVPTLTGPTSACLNSTGNLYTTQGGNTNYIWNVVGGTITSGGTSTSNTATVTWTTLGTQSISVSYTDANGCTPASPTVLNITVGALPTPTITASGPTTFCAGGSVTLTASSGTSWLWSTGATTQSITVTTAGSYTVTVTNNGCSGTSAATVVVVNALPTPTLSGPNSVCLNSTGNVYTTQTGNSNYVWTVVGGTITAGGTSTSNTATVTWTSAGAKSISVNYTDANGCSATSATVYNVTVNPLPAPTLSGPTSVCLNSIGNVYSTQAGMTNYVWNVVGGTITAGGNSTSNTATITWTSTGPQSISVNYIDVNGCTAASATVLNITVNALPTATITASGSTTFCAGGSVTLTASAGTSWLWSTGATTQSITVTTAGSYSVTVTNANGCSATSATTTVVVNALPTPTLSGPTSVCLNSSGNIYTTEAGNTNYVWSIVGGTITAGGNSTSNTATVTWTTAGARSISVNYSNANGCTAASATVFNVTVNPLPTPILSGPPSACLNVPGNLYTTQAGNSNYIWSIVGGTITAGGNSTSNTATVTWTTAGTQSISINYTDANGCTAASPTVYNVTVGALPTATITPSGPTTFCAGGSVTLTASAGTSWLWSTGATTQSITVTTSGTYTVTVTIGNGCSATSNATTVVVNPLPTPTLSGPTSVCLNAAGNVYTTQAGNSNYAWTVVGGTITAGGNSTSSTATVTWTSTGARTISVNYTDANGCSATSATVFNVTVNPLPTPTLSGSTSACLNSVGNVYTTEAGKSNYVWAVVGGTITAGGNSTSNTATVTWTSTGPQSISVNYTDANGCSAPSATVYNVTINPLPTPTLSGPTSICLNSTGNVYTTQAGKTNYVWNVVGGTITAGGTSSSNTATVTWTTTGTQSISVNYSDANGCTAAAATIFNVTVNPLPTPTINGSTSACLNSAGNVYTTEAGKTNYTWTVVGGTITAGGTSTSNTVTITWTTAGTQSISINYIDGNGCTAASATIFNVTVKPLPTATINGTTETCLNSTPPTITFTGANGTAPYTFTYKINGGPNQTVTTTSGNSVTVPVPTGTAGTYTYTLVSVQEGSSNACNQNQTGSAIVTVNPLPTANFSTSLPACETNNITFTDASLPNAGTITKWTWDYGDGSSAVLTNGNPFNHVYATANTYNVTLTVETNKGCVSTILTKQIVVNVRPQADFVAPVVCVSDPVVPFTDASQITAGSITAWNWSFDDGGTSTQQNPSHPFGIAGNHSAQLITTSNQGCKDTISRSFFVNGTPTANYTVQNPNALCSNQVVNIVDASSITAGNIIRTEIYWDYNNDPTIKTVDNSPVIGRSYTYTYPEFGSPASRTVSIRYVTYSGITCLSSSTKTVTLLATPTLQFDPVTPVCSNASSFQITTAQILNGLSGSGTFSGTGVSSTGFFDVAAAGSGSHTIRYTYNANNGCSNYIEQIVKVNPTPVVNAGPDKVVLEGGVVQLTPALQIGGPIVTYLWTPSTGLTDPTNPYTNASPTADITYTLTVRSDQGCTASDQVFVKLLKAPVIPNIFSPNNDGVHDKWEINYLSTYPGCTVDIYNRYGQLVFHSVGYSTPWDGTVHGTPVPVGTYYYIVNPKNGRKLMTGYVDVIR